MSHSSLIAMARYTRSLSIALPLQDCLTQIKAVLENCNLEVLFSKEDCIIARERPGQVPFAKLVAIEVLVDSTRATKDITSMEVVVKNEELPLQSNNHCFQIFDHLSQSLNQHSGWRLLLDEVDQTASSPMTAVASQQPIVTDEAQPPLHKLSDDSISLESVEQKRFKTTTNLEELRQKRAESVANLERLRQKRAESIANMEKMRQKRERVFAANERLDKPGEDRHSLDLPEQPSTSQA
jgi:hypothetical protein